MNRPLLGVGWDVGGWIGKAQAVAVATLSTESVSWLGTARTFALRKFDNAQWTLLDLIRMAWTDAPADTLEQYRVVLAVDSPFGFPMGFVDFLNTGSLPPFDVKAREIDNPLAYRECDRYIHATFNKKPLSASFDKLGNNATVAMHHVRRLARLHAARVLPFDAPDEQSHTIIEVYPALSKVPGHGRCYATIQRHLPDSAKAGTDACDACICSVMALAFGAAGSAPSVPVLDNPISTIPEATLRVEGWIYCASREALGS